MNLRNSPSSPLIKPNRYFPLSRDLQGFFLHSKGQEKILKKYYARKILYVQNKTDLTAAINRSKYFLHFKISSSYIIYYDFKSLANLIMLRKDISLKYLPRDRFWHKTRSWCFEIHPLQLKKALRSCKNPQPESPQLKHLQHLFHLKSLTLHVNDGSSMNKASKIIRKLRLLKSLHVKYLADYHQDDPKIPIRLRGKSIPYDANDQQGWGFFYKISKLPRLQRFFLQTSIRTLEAQSNATQQDFADFYCGSHKFKIDTEIYVSSDLDSIHLAAKNITSILKTADSLSIQMGIPKGTARKNPYACQDKHGAVQCSEEENMKTLKQGERPVKFYVLYKENLQVNIGCLLAKCESLASLYLKISGAEVVWDQNYENFPQKLHTVVLDVDFLGLKYEILDDRRPFSRYKIEEEIYEIARQRKVKFHSGLLELLKQLKTRATGLNTLTLFMCLANFKKSWYQPKSFKDLFEKILEEKTKEFFKELESFEKLHRIYICKKPEDQSLDWVLAAKSLKMVNVRWCCNHLEKGDF